MWKEKIDAIRDFLVKHSKYAFPIIVVAAVAVTVAVALNAGNEENIPTEEGTSTSSSVAPMEVALEPVETDVPLVLNEDGAISTLILTYYNALALGDSETLNSVCDVISEKDMLHYLEMAKYIEFYPNIEIYTKPGLEEGSTIAYVYYKVTFANQPEEIPGYKAHFICTNEQGELYMKRSDNSEEVNEYIMTVSAQDDLVEFNNRINVEYNELIAAHPEILEYLKELDSQVSTAVGVALAQQEAQTGQETQEGDTPGEGEAQNPVEGGEQNPVEGEQQPTEQPPAEQQPQENIPQYATATTTVNVRSSDSQQADKLGKVAGGEKVQVLQQRVNGWTKILFEGKEGFIKSEYLQMIESAESAAGTEVIGTITAIKNVNVRTSANENSEKLGVLVGGDSAELIANENGWCKIKYDGKIGYVKADYVQ